MPKLGWAARHATGRPSKVKEIKAMTNIDPRAASDSLLIIIRRIEPMPGPWRQLTDGIDKTLRRVLATYNDAIHTFLDLPPGRIETGAVKIKDRPYMVVRARRGFEQRGDPYVIVIGSDDPDIAVLENRPQNAGRH